MRLVAQKSNNLVGIVEVPPTKTHTWRALIFASLADGTSKIINPKISSDWHKGVKAMEMFGAEFKQEGNVYFVKGTGKKLKTPDDIIDCGNSGPLLRFVPPVAANCEGYTVFSGDESIRYSRPAQPMIEGLKQLGAFAVSTRNNGLAPIVIGGKMKGGKAIIEDGRDSQPISGLLIGSSLLNTDTEIIVKNAGEKPWIGLTIHWMKKVGLEVENIDNKFEHYIVKGGRKIQPFEEIIPCDWQSAPYPLLAGLITPGSRIEIPNLDPEDVQADRLVVEAFQKMGADITCTGQSFIARYSQLRGIEIDCNDFVDQFMVIAIAAAYAKGTTIIKNVEIQRYKECDRIDAMYMGLKAMGADVEEKRDGLIIKGGEKLHGATIDGRKDHRVVATFAIAGLQAEGKTVLTNAETLNKSFHDFEPQMKKIGAQFTLIE